MVGLCFVSLRVPGNNVFRNHKLMLSEHGVGFRSLLPGCCLHDSFMLWFAAGQDPGRTKGESLFGCVVTRNRATSLTDTNQGERSSRITCVIIRLRVDTQPGCLALRTRTKAEENQCGGHEPRQRINMRLSSSFV